MARKGKGVGTRPICRVVSEMAMFHQQFRNEGCAMGPEVTQVLKVLTAYTLRMMLYSH
jgi:hypothetical protein